MADCCDLLDNQANDADEPANQQEDAPSTSSGHGAPTLYGNQLRSNCFHSLLFHANAFSKLYFAV